MLTGMNGRDSSILDMLGDLRLDGFVLRIIDRPIAGNHCVERGGGLPDPLAVEDVDMVRRIGRRRMVPLKVTALTSNAKYEGWAMAYRPPFNLLCLALYFAGVPPKVLARFY